MLIGLTGPAGAGKDTVADILVQDYGFKKLFFASTLKRMLEVAGFAEPAREFKEELVPGYAFSWRDAAQKMGTEWGRALDPDIWVKITMAQTRNIYKDFVISDCRFENEAMAIREQGVLVHVRGRRTNMVGDTANHASEKGVTFGSRDLEFDNSGSLEAVADNLRAFLRPAGKGNLYSRRFLAAQITDEGIFSDPTVSPIPQEANVFARNWALGGGTAEPIVNFLLPQAGPDPHAEKVIKDLGLDKE